MKKRLVIQLVILLWLLMVIPNRLLLALCLDRHVNNKDEVSNCFKQMSYDTVKVKLLLVINGNKDEWLAPLNEALLKLKNVSKIWPLEVITIARKYHLIQVTA